MARLQRQFRAVRSFLMVTFSVAVITLALLVAVARALLPYADHAAGWVESLVSKTIDRTVSTDYVEGHWRAFGPEFYIDGLAIEGPDGQRAQFNRASVRVDLYGALLGTRPLVTVTVFGANMQVRRADDGRLHVAGVELKQQIDLSWLIQRGRLELAGSRVELVDAQTGFALDLTQVNLAVADGAAVRLEGQLPEGMGGEISIVYRGNLLRALSSDGQLYASVKNASSALLASLPLPDSIPTWQGRVDGELWLETIDGRPADVSTRLALISPMQAGEVVAVGNWRPTLNGWDGVADITTVSRSGLRGVPAQLQVRRSGERLQLSLDRLDLEPLLGFLPSLNALGEMPWQPSSSRLGGQVTGLSMQWQQAAGGDWRLQRGSAQLESFLLGGIAGRVPDIEGVEVSMAYAGDTLALELSGDAAVLHYPPVFPQSLLLGELDVAVRLTAERQQPWRMSIDRARTLLAGAEISLQGQLHEDADSGVFADLRYGLREGDARWMADVLPMGIMPTPLTEWLLASVEAGQVHRADGVLYGPLRHFPFRDQEGRFEILAELHDARLKFRPEWPALDQLSARLQFVNNGLRITADKAFSEGMRLTQASAEIASYSNPRLLVDAQASAQAGAVESYLRASPLMRDLGPVVNGMQLRASAILDLSLGIPLAPGLDALSVNGDLVVEEGSLRLPVMPWPVENLNASVAFDRDGIRVKGGRARLDSQPFEVDLAAGQQRLSMQARGRVTPSSLLGKWLVPEVVTKALQGSTDVTVDLSRRDDGAVVLGLGSSLAGLAIEMPAPLAKPAQTERALQVAWPLGRPGQVASLEVANLMQLLSKRQQDGREWVLRFGSGRPELSGQSGVSVSGRIRDLDADGWLTMLAAVNADDQQALTLRGIDVTVDNLRLMRRRFADLDVEVGRDDRYWTVRMDGAALAGELRLPASANSADVVVADLQRLHWPSVDEKLPAPELPSPSVGSELPSLQILADEVRLGDYLLGEFRLEAFPDMDGYRIERLETRREGTDIIASGHWYRGARPRSVFEGRLTARDLGQLLSDFGYANLVRGGQTRLGAIAEWPGPPWDVELANLQARLDVDIGQGQIVEVEPGAGRVLGLLSLQALPRRLALDFRDFFGEGLSFDSMAGRFEFDNGIARTDELAISALSADIVISGSTDLVNQTYDQTVIVVPNMSNALPVVGALAGGAAGAAALWVLQDALQAPMGQMARARYRVSGPWQSPDVQRVETDLVESTEAGTARSADPPESSTPVAQPCETASNEESECR